MVFQTAEELLGQMEKLSNTCYFRGYQKKSELISSLGRRECIIGSQVFKKFVRLLYKNGFPPQSFKELLCLAQHYGIPTNLIDLTTDPYVSLFFGLGREPCKQETIEFHILVTDIQDFKSKHKNQLRTVPIILGDIDNLTLSELDALQLQSISCLSEDTEIATNYLQTSLLENLYDKYFQVQSDYVLVEYTKHFCGFNKRIIKQSGLFILSPNKKSPIPTEWFEKIDVSLTRSETEKLVEKLNSCGYTSDNLLPPMVNEIDIAQIAKESME